MPITVLEATVICVHGEGGRERAIATAMDQVQIAIQQGALKATPDVFADAQNVQPTVVMVLRRMICASRCRCTPGPRSRR